MTSSLVRLVASRKASWVLVVLTLFLAAVTMPLSLKVQQDDDLLAFLPEGNEDIDKFRAINERFGGLDVGLIGIEVDDPFEASFLTTLRQLTIDLRDADGVNQVLSLTSITDFTEDPMGGIITSELIDHIPTSAEDSDALRTKAMSRDHVVGNLVAANGKAVLLYVFHTAGGDSRAVAGTVRDLVETALPEHTKYWGGAPFISGYIYETTQADMARLTPWAVFAIVVIILLSFRDVLGSGLALLTTGMGIWVSQAAMVVLGIEFNIVLSAMPVILFAVGSAYSIHMLSRYYLNLANSPDDDRAAALERTLRETAPTVVAAGLTTVAGLGSFVLMDIRPMRTFGVFTALGILTTLVLSVTFVPAVIRLANLGSRTPSTGPLQRSMVWLASAAQRNPTVTGVGLLLVALAGGSFVTQVDTRMDQAAFFAKGSPPDLAQKFLDAHFGGSQFIQVQVEGNMSDPHVLRQVEELADEMRSLELVSRVDHIAGVIATVNEAMAGQRRVPDKENQAGLLYGFLAGNPAVGQLVTDPRDAALLQAKIGASDADSLERALAAVEAVAAHVPELGSVASTETTEAQAALLARVSARVRALARDHGVVGLPNKAAPLVAALQEEPAGLPTRAATKALDQFLRSPECFVELPGPQATAVAKVTAALGPGPNADAWRDALLAVLLPQGEDGEEADEQAAQEAAMVADDLMAASEGRLADIWKEADATARASRLHQNLKLELPKDARSQRFMDGLSAALIDLGNPEELVADPAGDRALSVTVSGLPVMYRGLSQSVSENQKRSLGTALVLVYLIMSVLFRSPWSGLVATAPTAVTLLVVYGGMGALGVHLDIGTSMLGSLIIGAGVDYAVHLVAAWKGDTPEQALELAVDDTAPAIWTNALMVAAGFFVLTLGQAKPLQNVGGLTAAAMLVAALATFLAIPVLAGKAKRLHRG